MPFGMVMPRLPTPLRLYAQSWFNNREPITEEDFTGEELAALRQLTVAAGMPSPLKSYSGVRLGERGASRMAVPATPGTVSRQTYTKEDADVPSQQWLSYGPNGLRAPTLLDGLLTPQGRAGLAVGLTPFQYNTYPSGRVDIRREASPDTYGREVRVKLPDPY